MLFSDGAREGFAIECVLSSEEPNAGRIFIYVKGSRFGQDEFNEDLPGFFHRLNSYLENPRAKLALPGIFSMDAHGFVAWFESRVRMDSAGHGTRDAILQRDGVDFGDVYERIFIPGELAFDRSMVVLIPNGTEEKLVVLDVESRRLEEVVLTSGSFQKACDSLSKTVLDYLAANGRSDGAMAW